VSANEGNKLQGLFNTNIAISTPLGGMRHFSAKIATQVKQLLDQCFYLRSF